METIYFLYLLIGVISISSFYGFNHPDYVQKFIFSESRIQNEKQYYRMLTSSFLHGDMVHLFFNMFVLYQFGEILLINQGVSFFYGTYFASVLGGSVLSYLLHRGQWMYTALGASGGVSGVLMAFVVLYPDVELSLLFLPIPLPGFVFVFLYLVYEVYSMINPKDNIGHDAHLGGAIVGFLFGLSQVADLDTKDIAKLIFVSLPLLFALIYSIRKIKSQ